MIAKVATAEFLITRRLRIKYISMRYNKAWKEKNHLKKTFFRNFQVYLKSELG